MSKKLITACLGLGVALAALALPAVASAAPELTHPTNTRLAVGTKITGTNVNGNTKFYNDAGTAVLSECTTAILTGELTKNNGTEVEANITTATFEGTGGGFQHMSECTATFGNLTVTTNGGGTDGENVTNGTPWCVRATNLMAADEFQIRGGKCSEAAKKITYIFDTTNIGECKYERAAGEPIKGTFATDTSPEFSDAIMRLKPGAGTTFKGEAGNNVLCPSTGTLEMSFTLETDNILGEPLWWS